MIKRLNYGPDAEKLRQVTKLYIYANALNCLRRGTEVDREFPVDVHLRSRLQSRRPTPVYLNTNEPKNNKLN